MIPMITQGVSATGCSLFTRSFVVWTGIWLIRELVVRGWSPSRASLFRFRWFLCCGIVPKWRDSIMFRTWQASNPRECFVFWCFSKFHSARPVATNRTSYLSRFDFHAYRGETRDRIYFIYPHWNYNLR